MKSSSTSLVRICEKWDLCYDKLEAVILKRPPPTSTDMLRSNSDVEVYEKLTGDTMKKDPFK